MVTPMRLRPIFVPTTARLAPHRLRTSQMIKCAAPSGSFIATAMAVAADANAVEDMIRSLPTASWTIVCALLVLGIGHAFEVTTHTIRHKVPRSLLPVVEAVLAELTTLGFSGIFLSSLQASSEDSPIGHFSERYLGEAGELFELFEAVDAALFPTIVAFCGACSVLVAVVNSKFRSYRHSTQSELLRAKLADDAAREACAIDPQSAACADARRRSDRMHGLLLSSMHTPATDGARLSPVWGALLELVKPEEARRAEFLRFRARFIERDGEGGRPLPDDFHFGSYLARSASDTLSGLVSVDPVQLVLVWMPLILLESAVLYASGGVDGDFLPSLFALAQMPIGVWAGWNYVRLHRVKSLLTPQLGVLRVDPDADGGTTDDGVGTLPARRTTAPARDAATAEVSAPARIFRLLPPRYKLLGGTSARRRTWLDALAVVERHFAQPARSEHDELWGALGAGGPEFYLASMKLVLFSAIVSLAYFGGGGSDALGGLAAEWAAATAALPPPVAAAAPPLAVALAVAPSVMAVGLAPFTFLNYNWATSVEGMRRRKVIDDVLREQREGRFLTTLASLASLSAAIETAMVAEPNVGEAATAATAHTPARSAAEVARIWDHLVATQPPERLLDVRALFEAQDADGSGTIGLDEVRTVVRDLGYAPTDDAARALFGQMDVDRSGEVRFVEFAVAVLAPAARAAEAKASPSSPAALGPRPPHAKPVTIQVPAEAHGKLFDFFDRDGSGGIDEREMLLRLSALGFDVRGVAALVRDIAGAESDTGVVSKAAFVRYLAKVA